MFVPEALRSAAAIFEERNALYKDNYKKFGKWVAPLLQGRVIPTTVEEWGRFAYLLLMLHKVSRIVEQFHEGGHRDSNDDLAVYAMMLSELENDARLAKDAQARQQDRMEEGHFEEVILAPGETFTNFGEKTGIVIRYAKAVK